MFDPVASLQGDAQNEILVFLVLNKSRCKKLGYLVRLMPKFVKAQIFLRCASKDLRGYLLNCRNLLFGRYGAEICFADRG